MKRLLQKIKQKTLFTWSDETAKISVRIANYTLAAAILFGFWVAGQATRQPDQNAYASIMQIAKLPVWLTMGSNNNNNSCEAEFPTSSVTASAELPSVVSQGLQKINNFVPGNWSVSGSFNGTEKKGECCTDSGELIEDGRIEISGNYSASLSVSGPIGPWGQEVTLDEDMIFGSSLDFTVKVEAGAFWNASLSISSGFEKESNECTGETTYNSNVSSSANAGVNFQLLSKICWGQDEQQCVDMGVVPLGASGSASLDFDIAPDGSTSGTLSVGSIDVFTEFDLTGFTTVNINLYSTGGANWNF